METFAADDRTAPPVVVDSTAGRQTIAKRRLTSAAAVSLFDSYRFLTAVAGNAGYPTDCLAD